MIVFLFSDLHVVQLSQAVRSSLGICPTLK